jgi:hypothetical protein
LIIGQTADYCGVDRAEVYYKMLRDLEIRRIGVGGGVMPHGRLIRIERGSLLRLREGSSPGGASIGSLCLMAGIVPAGDCSKAPGLQHL